jgi:hypothetical protein
LIIHFSKALLEKIIDDAQSLIETKKNNIYACRENISKRLLTPLEHVAHTMVWYIYLLTHSIVASFD